MPPARRRRTPERRTEATRLDPSGPQGGRPSGLSADEVEGKAAQRAIGRLLRSARTDQRLTQQQVASLTMRLPWRLSRAAVSAIERGQNYPGMEALLALSAVLYLDPNELIERARLAAVVPIDVTGISSEELEARAGRLFWAGDFRQALAVYDAVLERLTLEPESDRAEQSRRVATVEIRRATALKRAGALSAASAAVERAISIGAQLPAVQAEAYLELADIRCERANLPLASDAARRAVELAEGFGPSLRGKAWTIKARVHYLSQELDQATESFLKAREQARHARDVQALAQLDGEIGMCWLARGDSAEARIWISRAVAMARRYGQSALEAVWLVGLGRVAFAERNPREAETQARAALRIARPLQHRLTVFRAEWLRHRLRARRPGGPARQDRQRIAMLRRLFAQLDQHQGVEEIREFRREFVRVPESE